MGVGGRASRECFGPSGCVGRSLTARMGMLARVRLAIRPKAFSRGLSYFLDRLLMRFASFAGVDARAAGDWRR